MKVSTSVTVLDGVPLPIKDPIFYVSICVRCRLRRFSPVAFHLIDESVLITL